MSDEILDPDAPSDAEWLPVRAAMRDVAVPVDARELAISAALAAFDELHGEVLVAAAAASPASDQAAEVVSLQTRMGSRWTRWVGSAAAAVAVLAVGGLIINGFGGSSNDQVSIEPTAAVESAFSTDAAKMAEAATENATAVAPMAGTTDELGGTSAPPTIGSIGSGAEADTTMPNVVVAMAPTEEITSTDELTEYATRTAAAPPMADLPDSACNPPGSEIIGVVTFQGVTAIVVRNADSSYSAIAADTCAVLATVTP